MMHFDEFITDGNEKEGKRREQIQSSRSEKRCTQLCSMRPVFIVWQRNGNIVKTSSRSQKKNGSSWTRRKRIQGIERNGGAAVSNKHRTEWCATTNKHRCMRCGRGSKYKKMQGKCTRPKYLAKNLGKW